MNINAFSQKPQTGRTYAKNEVPTFVITTQDTLLAVLTIGNETIFQGSFSPDFNGQISIDFKGLYDNYLQTNIPSSSGNEIVHTSYRRQFTATFYVLIGEDTTGDPATLSWYVANAKWKSSSLFYTFANRNFLSNQPIEKVTNYESPEWVSWMDLSGATRLDVRFYKNAGGSIDETIFTAEEAGCFSVNVRYSRLIRMLDVLARHLKGYYDIILYETKHDTEVCRQRYIYNERTGKEKYYCFVNALGGIDTLICNGENVLQPDTAHNIGRFADSYRALDDTDDQRKWSQAIGMIPSRHRNWIYEILTSKQGAEKYDPEAMDYYGIVVDASDISMGDNGQLATASFTYILDDTDNAIADTERAVGRSLHQSVADEAEAFDDITKKTTAKFEDDGQGGLTTDEIEIGATKLYVSDTRTYHAVVEPPIYYFLDGSETAEGSFTPGADPYIINKSKGETIRFATQNDAIESLLINYY